MRTTIALVAALALAAPVSATPLSRDAEVRERSVAGVVVDPENHATLAKAAQVAGLRDRLQGGDALTLFAPADVAFDRLPPATLTSLLQPAQRAALKGVLKNHLVKGRVTAADLQRRIADGGGSATLTTLGGGTLTAKLKDGRVVIKDAKGAAATVTAADLRASNGVVHSIDTVLGG